MVIIAVVIILANGCSSLQKTIFKKTPLSPSDIYDRAVSKIEEYYLDPSEKPIKLDISDRPNLESLISQLTYSELIPPTEVEMLQNPFTADIGIVLRRGNSLRIIGSIKGSPASRVGINYDDKIIEINNQTVENLRPFIAVNMLQGQPGSEVSIKILGAENEIKTFKLVRELIKFEDCGDERIIKDGIGYVHLRHFDIKTADKIKSAVKRLQKKGMVALVIDLRANSGGLLESVSEASQLFIASGKYNFKTLGRNFTKEYYSRGWSHYTDFPMVVLTDINTESGAEIMAAALKENGRAALVGEKTAGSAVIRTVIPLQDGHFLLLRSHQIETAQGNRIEGIGVYPDIEVKMSTEERRKLYSDVILNDNANGNEKNEDSQLEVAVSHLLKQIKSSSSNIASTIDNELSGKNIQ